MKNPNSNSTALTIMNSEDRIRQVLYNQIGPEIEGRRTSVTPKVIRLLPGPNGGIDPDEWAKVEKTPHVKQLTSDGTLTVHTNFDPEKVSMKEFERLVKSAASVDTMKLWYGRVRDTDKRKMCRKRIDDCTKKAS